MYVKSSKVLNIHHGVYIWWRRKGEKEKGKGRPDEKQAQETLDMEIGNPAGLRDHVYAVTNQII